MQREYLFLGKCDNLIRKRSWGRLWNHKDFTRFWTAETVGVFGKQFTALALPTIAIKLLNAQSLEIGILNALEDLAFPLLGLQVGVWVDRWRRRPIMIAANLARVVAMFSVSIVFLFATLHMYFLYVVAFAVGVFTVFFDIAYQAYLPTLIERSDLVEGNSKLETSQSAARPIGYATAGFLIDLLGAAKAIAADAAAFFISAALIFSIRKHESAPETIGERRFWVELKEGAVTVFGDPLLRRIAACTATLNFGTAVFFVVFYLFAYAELKLSPTTFGLILSLGSVGYVIGAIIAPKFLRILGLGRALMVSVFLSGLVLVAMPLALYGPSIPIVTLLWFSSSILFPVYNVNQISLRQAITPDRLQGRMNATMRTFVWGVLPLGALVGGILGTYIGIVPTLIIGALISTLAAVWVLLPPVISLRDIPQTAKLQ